MKFIKILIVLLLLISLYLVKLNWQKFTPGPTVDTADLFDGVSYKAINNDYEIGIVNKNLFSPTRVKITPDGKHMFVTQLTGEVLSFDRQGDKWSSEPYLVSKVNTKFKGFPPDEAGLVGVIFSNNYEENGKIFLLYTYKAKDGAVKNRISLVKTMEVFGKLRTLYSKVVFEANTTGAGSHQITDGISILVDDKPHLLFLIGEGFDATKSQKTDLEAGKIMLLSEDGKVKKILARGLRNGYALALNPNDEKARILISDTGPEKYDRLIYTNPLLGGDLNFNWDGTEESLNKILPDPNFSEVKDMVITKLEETLTFSGIDFQSDGSVLLTMFGKTGYKDNSPGKNIQLGRLSNLDSQPVLTSKTIISRVDAADGKLGNPLGMVVDRETNDFFFLDILEGRLYQVKKNGGGDSKINE